MPDSTIALPVCTHENFHTTTGVHRRSRNGAFTYCLEVEIVCKDCGEVFNFAGMPTGHSSSRPTVSHEGNVAYLPIAPSGTRAEQQ